MPKNLREYDRYMDVAEEYPMRLLDKIFISLANSLRLMAFTNFGLSADKHQKYCPQFKKDLSKFFHNTKNMYSFWHTTKENVHTLPLHKHPDSDNDDNFMIVVMMEGAKLWSIVTDPSRCGSKSFAYLQPQGVGAELNDESFMAFNFNPFYNFDNTAREECDFPVYLHHVRPRQILFIPQMWNHAHGILTAERGTGGLMKIHNTNFPTFSKLLFNRTDSP